MADWVVNLLSVFQLTNKEVIREGLHVDWPKRKMDSKQQGFVKKTRPAGNMWLLFWKELQNWKVQKSVDVMYFKLRQTLDTTIYEMTFARTNSRFRLQCGYKPGRECENIWGYRWEGCRYVCKPLGLLLLQFQELYSYIWVWTKIVFLATSSLMSNILCVVFKVFNTFLFPVISTMNFLHDVHIKS